MRPLVHLRPSLARYMATVADSSTAVSSTASALPSNVAGPSNPGSYPYYTVLTPSAPPRPASHSTAHYVHFRDLPRPIFRYVSQYMRENVPPVNPEDSEPRLLQIAAPGDADDGAGGKGGMPLPWREVKVPNPFLLLKQQVLRSRPLNLDRLHKRMDADLGYLSPRPHQIFTEGKNVPTLISPIPGTPVAFRTVRPFSPMVQKKMMKRFAPECLPPSQTNPLENPKPLLWLDQTLIHWEGEWAPKVKRLPYEGRKVMFKGKKWERERPFRQRATQLRMDGMAKRISQYKAATLEEKEASRPSLPF